nr:CpsB/CapC family capsule biosynthesis tyrosine phosphatase [Lactobacillus helveticus]
MKINNLVDLHCHILPAIDYGSPSLEASLELARQAVADEIRYILATPHTSYGSALPQSCR